MGYKLFSFKAIIQKIFNYSIFKQLYLIHIFIMKISPKLIRNIFRILPFGAIWLITGWFFLFIESTATGNQNLYPDSAITLTLPIFIFASFAIAITGLLVGVVELVLLEKRFKYHSFSKKVIYKFLIYATLMLVVMTIFFPIASSIEYGTNISDKRVWIKTGQFFTSLVFVNTFAQISFHLIISLFYAAISENLGHNVLFNFFTGKYHRPIEELRIFMFLDMKNSTGIAEKIGHKKYFMLLQDYYESMSEAIILHLGEVYQYIGDEVVVTWKKEYGLKCNNCIECFFEIKKSIDKSKSYFAEKYGLVPDFKAGIHLGEVTTGEVGALKKEIVYTGDVLNTTARIQGQCKPYKSDLIVSEILLNNLTNLTHYQQKRLGKIELKGKSEEVTLVALNK